MPSFSSFYSQKLRATIKDHQDVSKVDKVLSDSLKNGRPVFIKGFLREKCIERGLTLPDSGGDIKMRSFLDSLKHACKGEVFSKVKLSFVVSTIFKFSRQEEDLNFLKMTRFNVSQI